MLQCRGGGDQCVAGQENLFRRVFSVVSDKVMSNVNSKFEIIL